MFIFRFLAVNCSVTFIIVGILVAQTKKRETVLSNDIKLLCETSLYLDYNALIYQPALKETRDANGLYNGIKVHFAVPEGDSFVVKVKYDFPKEVWVPAVHFSEKYFYLFFPSGRLHKYDSATGHKISSHRLPFKNGQWTQIAAIKTGGEDFLLAANCTRAPAMNTAIYRIKSQEGLLDIEWKTEIPSSCSIFNVDFKHQKFATGFKTKLSIWDLSNGNSIVDIPLKSEEIDSINFGKNIVSLVFRNDQKPEVWSLDSRKILNIDPLPNRTADYSDKTVEFYNSVNIQSKFTGVSRFVISKRVDKDRIKATKNETDAVKTEPKSPE